MTLHPAIVGVRAAFVFMTRLPVGGFPYEKEHFAWAPAHFPLVGLIVGALSGLFLTFAHLLGPGVASTLTLLASVYLTGAFHEDGLADTADGLGGSHGPKKLFEIMKDSRIGTYGACALVFSILLRVALLVELASSAQTFVYLVWIATQGLARLGPVLLMATLPYVAGENAKGTTVARGGDLKRASLAMLWGALIFFGSALLSLSLELLLAWGVALAGVTILAGRTFLKRAGGYTGDFLGATEQALELLLLAVALASLRLEAG